MSRRVAIVTHSYAPQVGGVELHVREIARRLGAHGFTPTVLTHRIAEGSADHEVVDGVAVRRVPAFGAASAYGTAPELLRLLRRTRGQYDLLHVHNYHGSAALLAGLGAGSLPIVFTPHYHGVGHTRLAALLHRPYRHAGRWLLNRSRRVICVSEAESRRLGDDFPDVAGKLAVIPNGLDARGLLDAEPFPAWTGITILAAGRLEHHKRVDVVIRALAHLDARFRLVIVGDGGCRDELERLAADVGVAARVTFEGRLDIGDVRRWQRTADVIVTCSEQEAYGLALAEAIAAGAGVVATAIEAHREVAGGHEGAALELIESPADPGATARAIERVAAAGRRDMAGAPPFPSWDEVADRTAHEYRAAVR